MVDKDVEGAFFDDDDTDSPSHAGPKRTNSTKEIGDAAGSPRAHETGLFTNQNSPAGSTLQSGENSFSSPTPGVLAGDSSKGVRDVKICPSPETTKPGDSVGDDHTVQSFDATNGVLVGAPLPPPVIPPLVPNEERLSEDGDSAEMLIAKTIPSFPDGGFVVMKLGPENILDGVMPGLDGPSVELLNKEAEIYKCPATGALYMFIGNPDLIGHSIDMVATYEVVQRG